MPPQRLLNLAGRLLAAARRGTVMRHRCLVKNPFGLLKDLIGARLQRAPEPATPGLWDAFLASKSPSMWITQPGDHHRFELQKVAAALMDDFGEQQIADWPAHPRVRKIRPEPSAFGRNCKLFDRLRFWAYDHQEKDGGFILDEGWRMNAEFADPLPPAEVVAIARSVARFMNTKFKPRSESSTRGRDAREGVGLDRVSRQRMAGLKSSRARAAKTDAAIEAGLRVLRQAGVTITQATLVKASGKSLRTIKSRWDPAWKSSSMQAPSMVQIAALSGNGAAPHPPSRPTTVTSASRPPRRGALSIGQLRKIPLPRQEGAEAETDSDWTSAGGLRQQRRRDCAGGLSRRGMMVSEGLSSP